MLAPSTILNKLAMILALSATAAVADVRNIPMIVPFSAGGPTDQIWRAMEPAVNQELAVQGLKLVTEYKPGAGAMVAANHIAQASTTTVGIFSTALVIAPNVNPQAANFKPQDFVLVAYAGSVNMVVVSNKYQTRDSLVRACQQDSVTYGSSGIGSATHLFGELVAQELKCKPAIHVPYKGMSAAAPDLQAGRIDFLVDFATSATAPKLDVDVDRFPLENWHVVVANASADAQDLAKIQKAFDAIKKNSTAVKEIQQRTGVQNLGANKDTSWLHRQFHAFQKFVTSHINKI